MSQKYDAGLSIANLAVTHTYMTLVENVLRDASDFPSAFFPHDARPSLSLF